MTRFRLGRSAAALLPPTRGGRMLLVAFLVDPLGTGLFLAGATVFFTREVGLSAAQVGVGLSVAGVVGMAGAVPLGVAADRWGVRRVQTGLHLWRATGLALYTVAHSFWPFLLIAAVVGVGDRASPPLNQALVALAVPEADRIRTMSVLRSAKNLAFTVGGLLAVLVLSLRSTAGYRALVLGDAVTFVAAALIVARLPLLAGDRSPARHGAVRLPALRDRLFVTVTAVNGALSLHSSLLLTALPLYVLHRTRAPDAVVGALFVVNTVLVTLFQLRASRGISGLAGVGRGLRRAGGWLAASCAVLSVAAGLGPLAACGALLVGVVLLTVGEMLQAAGAWEVSFALAPADRRAEYLSVFGLGGALEGIAGPALLTVLLVQHGPIGWPVMIVAFAGAGVAAAALVARPTTPAAPQPAAPQPAAPQPAAPQPAAPQPAAGRSTPPAPSTGATVPPHTPAPVGSTEERFP